jgi:hypothetical protein
MTQKELWDKFLEVEQQIFKLKFIIQSPITPDYPILPEFISEWRKDCDRAQNDLANVLHKAYEFVEGDDCNKQ